ncbi:rRNA maturation RNase YbeY [Solemya elarraichensis gill symbiont]|uniref:Endoribonuclease YbeY n=2 Tax=Solemya elarraichensis gill symbiont TaxID=1918949 RepID=A0A1T2KYP5_9GAMM|nr:rRNA maturation RNase YbeY [Solemya elarraichensis gill symbiont]
MMLHINLQVVTDAPNLPNSETLQKWAEAAMQSDEELSLVVRIVDEEESKALNSSYRNKHKPTNVLSFPFEAPAGIEEPHLGDLVICAPILEKEAREQKKPLETHWAHIIVHGVLHLQGLDHQNDAEAEEMESLERQILAHLGYPDPYATTEPS